MKTGRTLPDLAAELYRQANAKRDFLAPAEALRLQSNGHSDLHLKDAAFAVNTIAHAQIADYTGIPKPFYDRLRSAVEHLRVSVFRPAHSFHDSNDPLFDVLVNCLLQQKGGEKRLVRTLDGNARAFLSSTFNSDLDNFDVFGVAARAMEQVGLCPDDVASCEVTERRLYLKVVSPRFQATIHPSNLTKPHGSHHLLKEPQVVQAGFLLSNSETGLGSLTIQQTVYKLQCTNLWITEEAYRKRHLGKALEADEAGMVYKSDTRQAEAKARLLKLRDQITEALEETRFQALVARMQETTEVKLEGSVEQIVEVTARRFGLLTSEKEDILKNLIEGADLSLWGLSNAVTATAQSTDSYDRATEIEAIGGRLFSLPSGEIKEIVRAA